MSIFLMYIPFIFDVVTNSTIFSEQIAVDHNAVDKELRIHNYKTNKKKETYRTNKPEHSMIEQESSNMPSIDVPHLAPFPQLP